MKLLLIASVIVMSASSYADVNRCYLGYKYHNDTKTFFEPCLRINTVKLRFSAENDPQVICKTYGFKRAVFAKLEMKGEDPKIFGTTVLIDESGKHMPHSSKGKDDTYSYALEYIQCKDN